MKKIFNIFIFITLGLLLASCEKDTGVDVPAKKMKVIESNVLFEQEGGTGYIKLEAEESVTATTEQDWIGISVSGKTITVSVGANNNIGGRNGVVVIKSGSETIEMAVMQLSALFRLVNAEDADSVFPLVGETRDIPYSGNASFTLSPQDSWVRVEAVTVEGNKYLRVTVDPNSEERTSKIVVAITYEDGHQDQKTINITQELLYADLLGEWEMTYNTSASGTVDYNKDLIFSEAEVDNQYDVTGLGLNSTMRVVYNTSNKNLEIYPSQDMGPDPNNSSRRLSILLYSLPGNITWGAAYYYKGVKDSNPNDVSFTFTDSGTWSGYSVCGLYGVSTSVIPVASGTYSALAALHHYNISIVKK
ncbi:hypothetical protein GGR21_003309 [Dysgonomonas hofstadii]|uniref:BACON domain-containing protein n=1 Tax=Dysgonomonas hofstadii TaxID=637886 RepID=A0A840CY94_9BACT|nr:BACON domain-containing carbohydrate-binding protein [Dysgonomonas hofstadii]MBB4037392.1 hypothetical protein [Dysgonomonas hofstadii]